MHAYLVFASFCNQTRHSAGGIVRGAGFFGVRRSDPGGQQPGPSFEHPSNPLRLNLFREAAEIFSNSPAVGKGHGQRPLAPRGTDRTLSHCYAFLRQNSTCLIQSRESATSQLDRAQHDDAAGFCREHQQVTPKSNHTTPPGDLLEPTTARQHKLGKAFQIGNS